ncbi:MAG: toll/interleukin-1 receptor domain-containing protein [Oscillospiraceae bacterium]|nr:toll/interleukin-1 receptor domain-containing protein [Oscillospiraceae bacterium]
MKIFISWSKTKSKRIAYAIKDFLEGLFHDKIETWLSDENIQTGARPTAAIRDALKNYDKGIFCVLRENYESPWIMYEAGAISTHEHCDNENSDDCVIWPILFEPIQTERLFANPLYQFQFVNFDKEKMYKLAKEINNNVKAFKDIATLEKQFGFYWNELNSRVDQVLREYVIGSDNILDKKTVLRELAANAFPEPIMGDIIKFTSGFERQELYNILLRKSNKRLWLFGRKNKKIFANDNRWFFEQLKNKISGNEFDFRSLFLNPSAPPEIVSKAQKNDDFLQELKLCIKKAYRTIQENNLSPDKLCRLYDVVRVDEIIIVDDVVLFSHICFDENGVPFPLTDASFNVVEIGDQLGAHYVTEFHSAWNKATPVDSCVFEDL